MPVAVLSRGGGGAQVGADAEQASGFDLLGKQVLEEALEDKGYTSHGYGQSCLHGSGNAVLDQGGTHHRRLLLPTEGQVDDRSEPLADDHEGGRGALRPTSDCGATWLKVAFVQEQVTELQFGQRHHMFSSVVQLCR